MRTSPIAWTAALLLTSALSSPAVELSGPGGSGRIGARAGAPAPAMPALPELSQAVERRLGQAGLRTLSEVAAAPDHDPEATILATRLSIALTRPTSGESAGQMAAALEQFSAHYADRMADDARRAFEAEVSEARRRRGQTLLAEAAELARQLQGELAGAFEVEVEPVSSVVIDARHRWGEAAIAWHGAVALSHALAEGFLAEGKKVTILVNDSRLSDGARRQPFPYALVHERDYAEQRPVDLWVAPAETDGLLRGNSIPGKIRTDALTTEVLVPLAAHDSPDLPRGEHAADGHVRVASREIALQPLSRVVKPAPGLGMTEHFTSRWKDMVAQLLAVAAEVRRAAASGLDPAQALRSLESATLFRTYPAEKPGA